MVYDFINIYDLINENFVNKCLNAIDNKNKDVNEIFIN